MTQTLLPSGIPSIADYQACIQSPLFREMEGFSRSYLRANRYKLLYYSLRWSHDPLHHPTRQWEYPYIYERLEQARPEQVLDAGSGVTFFPYFLMSKQANLDVTCCDQDAYVGDLYQKLDDTQSHAARFEPCDLRSLPFEDKSFDALYCTSVLEHTQDYETIAREFGRVVAPAGRVIITFDISLDGSADIPVAQAEQLLEILASTFRVADAPPLNVAAAGLYDSAFGARMAPQGLFWSGYRNAVRLSKAVLGGASLAPAPMTFYCGEYAVE